MTNSTDQQRQKKKKPKKPGELTRQYEKNRRDRINSKLEELASMLPHYCKENPWQKKEIIENSIEFLLSVKAEKTENQELMRKMYSEIKALKDIIVAFSEFKYLKYDIFKLSSVEIRMILKQLSENNCKLLDKDKKEAKTNSKLVTGQEDKQNEGKGLEEVGEEHSYSVNNNKSSQLNQSQGVGEVAATHVKPRLIYVQQPTVAPVQVGNLQKLLVQEQPAQPSQAQLHVNNQNKVFIQQQPILAAPAAVGGQPKIYLQPQQLQPSALVDQQQQQIIITRGKSNYVLNGTQVLQIVPGGALVKVGSTPPLQTYGRPIAQDLGRTIVTSTVMANTGPKVSLIDLKKKKRPYLKRKLKTNPLSQPDVPSSKLKLESQPLAASTVAEPQQKAIALSEASAKEDGLEDPASLGVKVSSELSLQTSSGQLDLQPQVEVSTHILPTSNSELSESVTHTSIAAASESYEGHVTTSTSAAELEPLNDAGLADTLDEHLGGDIVGVDDQLDAAGLVVPLQDREHLNSSFSSQLEASLDTQTSLQFSGLDQSQSGKELGDLVALEKLEEGGEQKKQLQEKQRLEELKMINETIKEENIKETAEMKRELRRGEKKKKSSYSIPALCQISVNIGDRPDVASSPGVLSLNSVGTISPSHTPTPDKSAMESGKNSEDPVIEELKTIRPEELLQVEIVTGAEHDQVKSSHSSHLVTTSLSTTLASGQQTYLTSFPHTAKHNEQESCVGVNIQVELSQALTDLDREFNLDNINPVQDIKDLKDDVLETGVQQKTVTPSKTCPAPNTGVDQQSVYDFSCKPNSPPVPLHKTRKDSRSPRQAKEDFNRSSKQEMKEQKVAEYKNKSAEKKQSQAAAVGCSAAGHQLETYDERLVNQQQQQQQQGKQTTNYTLPPSTKQSTYPTNSSSKLSGGNYAHAAVPTTYHLNHAVPRHSYMASHYQYQSNQQSYHPYPQPVPVTEMKEQVQTFHQDPKYSASCPTHASPYPTSNIQDFHSRNYYKNYNTANQHYRSSGGFNHGDAAVGHQQYLPDRKHRHLNQQVVNQQQIMVQEGAALPDKSGVDQDMNASATFSVTQLVNTSQRKSSKKSSSHATKQRGKGDSERREKEDKRAGKGNSRRNRSGNRTNYSAESLLSAQGQVTFTTPDTAKEDRLKVSPVKNQKMSSNAPDKGVHAISSSAAAGSSSSRSNVNWSNEMNQHFSSLPFSSLSPSPGLFSSDLSSFEIGIFQQQESNSRDYFTNQVSNQQAAAAKSSKNCQSGSSSNQRSGADWGINSGAILDGSFLPPLPTMTPPTLTPPTEDPYAFMSHSHSGFYSCASVPTQRSQNVYTSHPPNLPVSGCATPSSMMKAAAAGTAHQGFPAAAQMFGISALGGGKVSSNTGSLVNFNLSTIFPEINIQQAPGPNCQSKPLVGIPPMPPPEFLQGPRSGQLGSAELLPHSISLLGHSSQVPTFTSTISSNMLPLPNLPPDREY